MTESQSEIWGKRKSASLTLEGRPKNRRGAMLVLVAVSMVGLMGLLVLTIDAGFAHRQRRMAQTAADAGAQAGALEIFRLHNFTLYHDSAVATAFLETTRNGFTTGVDNVLVTVSNPPASGSHSGDTLYVEVIVHQTLATFFGNILKQPLVSLQPRAVAGVVLPAQNCMVSLDGSLPATFEVVSGAVVKAINCNVAVNSNNSQALHVVCSGATSLSAPGGAISVTGNWYGCWTPPPNLATGVTPASDPLAYVHLQVSDTSGACLGGVYNLRVVSAIETLNPGNYCGGLKVTGNATFNPGLYVIKGGGFRISSGGTVNGAGVSFVDLNAPAADGGAGKFGIFDFASDAVLNVSAMTTGSTSGILFYAPAGTGDPSKVLTHRIHSGASTTLSGSLYFPSQPLELGSGGTLTINGGVVANTLQFTGDSKVTVLGFSGGGGFYTLKRASLVE